MITIVISPNQINNIAQDLDAGMKCFYHISTKEIKSYPDELKGHADFDKEFWEDVMEQVETAPEEYVSFEALESFESFSIMETFINNIEDAKTRNQFQEVIQLKRPFQQFKNLLLDYPDLRQQWFDFKNLYLIDHVQQ